MIKSEFAVALVANADPMTGEPIIAGEVACRLEELETFGQSWHTLQVIEITTLVTSQPEHYRAIVAHMHAELTPVKIRFALSNGAPRIISRRPLALTPLSRLHFFIRLFQAGRIGNLDLIRALTPEMLAQGKAVLSERSRRQLTEVARGTPISEGAVTGWLAADCSAQPPGRTPIILVIDRIEAHHTLLLRDPYCAGIVAIRGSPVDHFALLAREVDFPYMALSDHALTQDGIICSDGLLPFGSQVTVDFSSGRIYAGKGEIEASTEHTSVLAAHAVIAQEMIGSYIRLNIDSADDFPIHPPTHVTGIGLVRTEHMVRRGQMAPVLERHLETVDEDELVETGVQLQCFFEQELTRLFQRTGDRPVAIRLLDYPLHELGGVLAREINPMLGMRGVRQGIYRPSLYEHQIDAILRAREAVRPLAPDVEVLISLVNVAAEIEWVRHLILTHSHAVDGEQTASVKVGAVIETPAAALNVLALAAHSDVLSFGTNDLTQCALGLSREDYLPILAAYRANGFTCEDPFRTLHPIVLQMVTEAAEAAKQAHPHLTIGLCGVHATDPQAAVLCSRGLIDYLSVPQHQVMAAQLNILQAAPNDGVCLGLNTLRATPCIS